MNIHEDFDLEARSNFELSLRQKPKSASHQRRPNKRTKHYKEQESQTDEVKDLSLKCRSSLIESPSTKADMRKGLQKND